MAKKNIIVTNFHVHLVDVSFRVKENHFSINVVEKINLRFRYPLEFMSLFINGNNQYVGQEVNIAWQFQANHYREYSVAYARDFGKYTIGTRLKYNMGLADVSTERTKVTLFTDTKENNYALTMKSDYLINTAGINDLDSTVSASDYLMNTGNFGWGLDLGGTYHYSDKITFAASILDIGSFNWKSRVKNFHSNGEFTFDGIDINKLVLGGTGDTISFNNVTDTLIEIFGFDSSFNSYKTALIPKVYLSARYDLDSLTHVSALIYAEFFNGIQPAVAIMAGKKLSKHFELNVYWNYKNRSFLNLGLGWILSFGPLQIYTVGDNISVFFLPKRTKSYNIRFGMQWAFGGMGYTPKAKIPTDDSRF
ncbi:MAG: hypothetical protein IH946_12000 [Bacteroidetes bacterium]|nr:hypothetical protein [Bacteroidota bacterium]